MSPKEFWEMSRQEYEALGREAARLSEPKLRRVLQELIWRLAEVTEQARSDPELSREVQALAAEMRNQRVERERPQDEHD